MKSVIEGFKNKEEDILYNVNLLVMFAFGFLLWVDSLTGAAQYYGVPLGFISMAFKTPLILLMLIMVSSYSRLFLAAMLTAIGFMIIGPFTQFLIWAEPSALFFDFSLLLKVLTPIIAFAYFRLMIKLYPAESGRLLVRGLWLNFFAVVFNLLLGLAGFGYPSYAAPGGQGIGVNGFYVAGNELGACFLLLFGFVLHYIWNYRGLLLYTIVSSITLFFGLAIATKTAMLSSFLLIFAIPLFNERDKLFKMTPLKLGVFVPLIIAVIGVSVFVAEILRAIGLYDKVTWIIQEKGVLTLILSGRNEFASDILAAFELLAHPFNYVFGIGTVGISEIFPVKFAAEIDPVDLFVFFGFVGCLIAIAGFILLNLGAFKRLTSKNHFAPCIVAVNSIFFVLIFVSGHILYSGLLGIIWGGFNSLAYLKRDTQMREKNGV